MIFEMIFIVLFYILCYYYEFFMRIDDQQPYGLKKSGVIVGHL